MEASDHKKLFKLYPSPVRKTYGVLFNFGETLQVHYEIEVTYLEEMPDDTFLFELNKKQVYIDNKAPDKMIDKLADEMGKVLYPLSLKVTKQGLIAEVCNQDSILKRWKIKREELLEAYQGKVVAEGIQAMETVLQDNVKLTGTVRKDWFFSLFFSGFYGLQHKDKLEPLSLQLPMMPYAPLAEYGVFREITERNDTNQAFTITCRSDNTVTWAALPAKGSVDVTYKLYHADFTLRSITGAASLTLDSGLVKNVSFEIFHQPQQDFLLKNDRADNRREIHPAEVKRSFWNIFSKRT